MISRVDGSLLMINEFVQSNKCGVFEQVLKQQEEKAGFQIKHDENIVDRTLVGPNDVDNKVDHEKSILIEQRVAFSLLRVDENQQVMTPVSDAAHSPSTVAFTVGVNKNSQRLIAPANIIAAQQLKSAQTLINSETRQIASYASQLKPIQPVNVLVAIGDKQQKVYIRDFFNDLETIEAWVSKLLTEVNGSETTIKRAVINGRTYKFDGKYLTRES